MPIISSLETLNKALAHFYPLWLGGMQCCAFDILKGHLDAKSSHVDLLPSQRSQPLTQMQVLGCSRRSYLPAMTSCRLHLDKGFVMSLHRVQGFSWEAMMLAVKLV